MKRCVDNLILLFIVWPIGIFLGVIFILLRSLGRIKVNNRRNFPHEQKNMIIVANHPSFLEPVLLPLLFFPEYWKNPFLIPWSTPDRGLIWPILFWLKPRAVSINRIKSGMRDRLSSFWQILKILQAGGRIIFFPEGGRTFKQKKFVFSKSGKRLGTISRSTTLLASKAGSTILPIWVDAAEDVLPNKKFPWPRLWRKVVIKIGQPVQFTNITTEAAEKLTQILLNLADEG